MSKVSHNSPRKVVLARGNAGPFFLKKAIMDRSLMAFTGPLWP
jgi:hypothetical protein